MASQEDSKEARADNGETASQAADKEAQVHDEKAQADSAAAVQSQQQSADEQSEEKQILDFVDIFGQSYQAEIDPLVKKQDYKREGFVREGQKLSYQGDERYRFRLGVDVSYHQGTVDWAKVKEAGYDFAFLRIGYRGYGEAGRLCEDTKFYDNFAQARAAGLDVGVYFFSQAVNEREAAEEAEFVLQLLGGIDLQMPVVYDPEKLPGVQTRVDDLSREQFTQNVLTFTRLIRENGYEPMLYSNMLFEAYEYDLTQLSDLDIWYADYEPYPQTPYAFAIWQYTNEGQVDGISGGVDLNIQLLPR
ncbi:MAG: glycoside hydrolase family 25 protein [Lachnospiraceae bacterium]|nr:glycoside hydrolase family 25 protein [Lachnospiraceae bacterium]